MKLIISLLFLLLSSPLLAQISGSTTQTTSMPATTPELQCPVCPTCPTCARGKSEVYRDDSFGQLMFGYQFASTWVIGKTTASYTQIINRHWSAELEYGLANRETKIAGYTIGDMKEERYTLFGKYYVGNSFFVGIGPYYSKFTIKPTDKILDATNGRIKDEWVAENYGGAFAFGSRWLTKFGLTWGIDWVRINVPLKDGKVARRGDLLPNDDRETSRTFKILNKIPTFTFVGVNIGYTF